MQTLGRPRTRYLGWFQDHLLLADLPLREYLPAFRDQCPRFVAIAIVGVDQVLFYWKHRNCQQSRYRYLHFHKCILGLPQMLFDNGGQKPSPHFQRYSQAVRQEILEIGASILRHLVVGVVVHFQNCRRQTLVENRWPLHGVQRRLDNHFLLGFKFKYGVNEALEHLLSTSLATST